MSRHRLVVGMPVVGVALATVLSMAPAPSVAATPSGDVIVVTTFMDALARDGRCSLREAIRTANLDQAIDACRAGDGADTIQLAAGRYRLTLAGAGEDAALSGDLDVTSAVAIRGAGRYRTMIDGMGLDRVLDVHGAGRLRLTAIIVTGGETRYSDPGPWDGGGIASRGTLDLRSVVVKGNVAAGAGGGIASEGTLVMRHSSVLDNASGPDRGGGGVFSVGSASLRDVTVSDNTAASGGARDEGAAGLAATGHLVLEDSLVSGNHGSGEWTPGGVSMDGGRIVRSTIRYNQGGSYGTGGVVMTDSRMVASTVHGNAGGGDGGAGGVLAIGSTIVDSTISGNQAGGSYGNGGPWANAGGVDSVGSRIVASTIVGNTSAGTINALAGGLQAETGPGVPDTHVLGSIIARNRGTDGRSQDCGGSIVSDGYLLVRDPSGCDVRRSGTDLLRREPRLGPLADNGGPTLTHRLRAGSPAIDAWPAGTDSSCPDRDQRGVPRPQPGTAGGSARCDLGSVEVTRRD